MGARFFDLDLYGRFNGSGHPRDYWKAYAWTPQP